MFFLQDLERSSAPFLRRNIVTGRYQDLEHYLDVHFRLLREDFVGPFLEGAVQWANEGGRRGSRPENIRVYDDVTITGVTYGAQGIQYDVSMFIYYSKINLHFLTVFKG